MRLLLITNDFPPKAGGIQQTLMNIIDRWADPVRVLAPGHPEAEIDRRVVRHEHAFLWPTPGVRRWVEENVSDFQPDVIMFGAPHPLAMLGPGLRRRTGLPYVVMAHGAEVMFPSVVPGLRQILVRTLSSAGTVFAVSNFTAERVARLSGRRPEVLGAGVDVESFHPEVVPTTQAPESMELVDGDRPTFTLGCVSRLVPRKGHARVLRAAAELRERGHSVDVLIVGSGRLESKVRGLAARLGVPTRFEVDVEWERLPALYREMDGFVMPARSRWFGLEIEGLGIVYLEAAATALPVVAGSSGGAPETVDPGKTGFVEDSVAGIVEAVEFWMADPLAARAMGESGRKRVEALFTWEAVMDRFREGIAAVAEETARL